RDGTMKPAPTDNRRVPFVPALKCASNAARVGASSIARPGAARRAESGARDAGSGGGGRGALGVWEGWGYFYFGSRVRTGKPVPTFPGLAHSDSRLETPCARAYYTRVNRTYLVLLDPSGRKDVQGQ